jgi:hypothetical protein
VSGAGEASWADAAGLAALADLQAIGILRKILSLTENGPLMTSSQGNEWATLPFSFELRA